MQPPIKDGPVDGLEPEPSTRRVPSGSPASASGSAGEPDFFARRGETVIGEGDDVFASLKERISRLWDENPGADDIRTALIKGE